MKLDAIKLGLTLGIIWAGGVLCLAIMDGLWGWGGGLVKAVGSLYIGYKPTLAGSLIGMVWAFFDAGVLGLLIGFIYNKLLGSK